MHGSVSRHASASHSARAYQPGVQQVWGTRAEEPVRAYPVCPQCGLILDRDENAAITMLRAGQARQARTWPVGASVA